MRLLIVSSTIAFAAVTAFAQEPNGTATVRREVFAEHSAINLVNRIVRTKPGGQDGVLIVGASEEVSMSCFVPAGGSASCAPLKLSSVDAAQPIPSHDAADAPLLVHGLWGEPAIGLLDRKR